MHTCGPSPSAVGPPPHLQAAQRAIDGIQEVLELLLLVGECTDDALQGFLLKR